MRGGVAFHRSSKSEPWGPAVATALLFVWDRVPAETVGEGGISGRGMMIPLVQAGLASGFLATETGPYNDADDIDRLC